LVFASHGGSCEQGCDDQSGGQKFGFDHSSFSIDIRSAKRLASLGKWSVRRMFEDVSVSRYFNTARARRARAENVTTT
jgi:hypothetical protein